MRPDLRERVLASARAQPAAPRAVRSRRDVLILAAGAIGALGLFVFWGGPSAGGRTLAGLAVPAIGWAFVALVATFNAVSRAGSMLGRPTRALVVVAMLTAPVIGAWAIGCTAAMGSFGDPAPWNANLGCFIATLSLAAAPFVAFGALRRGSDPVHPRALGAALGASAGAWGGVLIDLHCVVSHWLHVALAHVAPIVILAALGAALGKRVFGVKSPSL